MDLAVEIVRDIKMIWTAARSRVATLVNTAMIQAYWEIGCRIVEEEQRGANRAEYGSSLLKLLASRLTEELDKHLDERELRRIRQFYSLFPKRDALRPELSWTHYRLLLRIEDPAARHYYMSEAADQGWKTRELERNIQSGYYSRILVHKEGPAATGSHHPPFAAADVLKDPYILEFLGLPTPTGYSESDLETAILSKLNHFLLEMGKGYAFVGRQYSIRTETKQFFIDLVFYNFLLRCFVLIDLKVTELGHADIGQMDMYVRMFDRLKRNPGDNPTIGIILCSEKDETLVQYSILEESSNLFASRYRLVLPTEEELRREVDREKELFRRLGQ